MRIEVVGKHLDLTDPVEQYAESKCEKLPRYFNGVQEIEIILEKSQHVEEFRVEIKADAVKHDTFVASAEGHDIYKCIDACVDKMVRQLTDFKEKLKAKQ